MTQIEATYAFHRVFGDFEELAEAAQQWNLDLRQLDAGPFHGELLQFGMGGTHISEARFRRRLLQVGEPPVGLRTIVVPAAENIRFLWRGIPVSGQDLIIFPLGADLASTSEADFFVYTCSFHEALLADVSQTLRVGNLDELRGDASVLHCRSEAIESVRECLRRICRRTRGGVAGMDHPRATAVGRDLSARLIVAILTSHGSRAPNATRKREMALTRAEVFIEKNAHKDISVRDISQIAQVSPRTLEYAFVERFGVTPKAFLKAHRLNGVRRELRAADSETDMVADIAYRWGFWHMGQFAADYRNHFDELPSQTLKRVASTRKELSLRELGSVTTRSAR